MSTATRTGDAHGALARRHRIARSLRRGRMHDHARRVGGPVGWKRRGASADERRTGYLMIGPAVLLVLAIAFFPVAYSWYLSVHDASITRSSASSS